jgi:tetratricopeptide (TPR) repeat protein
VAKVDDARQNIATGQFEAAEKLLSEAYALNDQEILVYVALGELSLAQGQLESAQAYVDAALWIQATRNQSKVEAILLAAEIAHAGGDQEAAERFYITSYDAIMQNSSYGWGSAGWSPYAWFVFQRNTFPEDLMRGYERADITISIAERLMGLAELYEEQGLVAKAKTIRSELATYLP